MGLPLALAFAKELPTTGLDIDGSRVDELRRGFDRNREVPEGIVTLSSVSLTADASCIADSDFIVVTVPTPVTEDHDPDLSVLESASAMIGTQLRNRSSELPAPIIVYESTTYPGCTEDFCGPIIERESGLKSGKGFFLGYSPERTNFGDAEHTLETVIKVVSGQTPEIAQVIGDMYGRIAKAGTHLAADIRTAEASKVIENVQRDLNIALFNELAMIFDRMNINSTDVFDAAATKWNFHRYQPGLVGGHCIPVDPYYLTHVSSQHGHDPAVILGGREINENMVDFIVDKIELLATNAGKDPVASTVLVLGQTFKKDVSDHRNSKAIQLADRLTEHFAKVTVYDPYMPSLNSNNPFDRKSHFDVVVVAVPHTTFTKADVAVTDLIGSEGILIDLGGDFKESKNIPLGARYWSL